jgi:hypothetical protein
MLLYFVFYQPSIQLMWQITKGAIQGINHQFQKEYDLVDHSFPKIVKGYVGEKVLFRVPMELAVPEVEHVADSDDDTRSQSGSQSDDSGRSRSSSMSSSPRGSISGSAAEINFKTRSSDEPVHTAMLRRKSVEALMNDLYDSASRDTSCETAPDFYFIFSKEDRNERIGIRFWAHECMESLFAFTHKRYFVIEGSRMSIYLESCPAAPYGTNLQRFVYYCPSFKP